MHMGIDQSRHECLAFEIKHPALGRFSRASLEDVLDHAVSHNHNSIRHGIAPVSIDQKGVLKNEGVVHEGF